jgi:hypothetical protein
MLIQKRKKHFRIDPEARTHIEQQTKSEFDADHQAELSLSDVLQLDIYRLNADVWERDRYTKPIEI